MELKYSRSTSSGSVDPTEDSRSQFAGGGSAGSQPGRCIHEVDDDLGECQVDDSDIGNSINGKHSSSPISSQLVECLVDDGAVDIMANHESRAVRNTFRLV